MGVMSKLGAVARVGNVAKGLSEVFVANATEKQAQDHEAHRAALGQLEAEFKREAAGPFDRAVDGLNRLPRPMLALGTLGLFTYAMVAPIGFSARMEGLAYVPEPLWWLLGAIVSFYFGARELHYRRVPRITPRPAPVHSAWHADQNAALSDWKSEEDGRQE
ncbi:MAG: holin family protein [Pseudomonadota bacterium]